MYSYGKIHDWYRERHDILIGKGNTHRKRYMERHEILIEIDIL